MKEIEWWSSGQGDSVRNICQSNCVVTIGQDNRVLVKVIVAVALMKSSSN